MKTYFYYAINDLNEGFICEAYNKKQMKNACMNMELNWNKTDSYNKAKNIFLSFGVDVKNASNVTQFKYQ